MNYESLNDIPEDLIKCVKNIISMPCSSACEYGEYGEWGGIILWTGEEYQFAFVENAASPDKQNHLYELSDESMEYIWEKVNRNPEIKLVASFHTHPFWTDDPSGIDKNQLFTSFPLNFIYSPIHRTLSAYGASMIKIPIFV